MGKSTKKSKKRVARTRGAGKYTESQFFSIIRSALRDAFRYWPPMIMALKKAERKNQSSNKKLKFEYQCNKCKEWFPRKMVQIDHIEECGSLRKYEDIVPFVQKLTKENTSAFQVLCKPDHKKKTKEYITKKENKEILDNYGK